MLKNQLAKCLIYNNRQYIHSLSNSLIAIQLVMASRLLNMICRPHHIAPLTGLPHKGRPDLFKGIPVTVLLRFPVFNLEPD